jgi:hypothetical protein
VPFLDLAADRQVGPKKIIKSSREVKLRTKEEMRKSKIPKWRMKEKAACLSES